MTYHAIDKSVQRYNMDLTFDEINYMIGVIKSGKSTPLLHLDTKDPRMSFHFVKYKKIPFKVLYKKKGKNYPASIITIYPLDIDEYNDVMDYIKQDNINKAIQLLKKNGYTVMKEE
jgi:hypothetical protein